MFGRDPMRRAENARAKTEAARAAAELREVQAAARHAEREQRREEKEAEKAKKAHGTGPWYVAAVMGIGISADTGWRYFGEVLGITDLPEHIGMFAVLETAMVAAGWAMRANVRRTGKPGSARLIAWALCAVAAYMAFTLFGPVAAPVRIALGPVTALIALHQAFGIEIKVRHGESTGTWARVGRELRERLLSRVGLADDTRDALERTRDRAAERAARLAVADRYTPFRRRRLARAVRASGAAVDPVRRDRMLALIAAQQHLGDLRSVQQPSPWVQYTPAMPTAPAAPELSAPIRATVVPELPAAPAPVSAPGKPRQPRPRSTRRPPSAERIGRALARMPEAKPAQIAARAEVSEATVRRHLRKQAETAAAESPAAA